MRDKLLCIPPLTLDSKNDAKMAENCINDYVTSFNSALHDAAAEVGCTSTHHYKPKAYWCPELSVLRDRKRFWWSLWVDNGRARHGVVFDCYKHIKRTARRISRSRITQLQKCSALKLNTLFRERRMGAFWNGMKHCNSKKVNSVLCASDFSEHYQTSMQDVDPIDDSQQLIIDSVKSYYNTHCKSVNNVQVSPEDIRQHLSSLNRNSAPGGDGISVNHLLNGMCDEICSTLAKLYSAILSQGIVPDVLCLGVIIPILKKTTLNPNKPENYRPIALSSTHAKLIELLLIPEDRVCDSQFGFRKGRGTSQACSFVNDLSKCCNDKGSPLHICTQDAEKCFDKIWHSGLFYKLKPVLPAAHWILIYRWYTNSRAVIRWNNSTSSPFVISRGTRQGSLLSPMFFNIFIDELLRKLKIANTGVHMGQFQFSSIVRWFIGDFTLTPQYFESSLSVNCHYSHFHRLPTISLNRVCH